MAPPIPFHSAPFLSGAGWVEACSFDSPGLRCGLFLHPACQRLDFYSGGVNTLGTKFCDKLVDLVLRRTIVSAFAVNVFQLTVSDVIIPAAAAGFPARNDE